MSATPSAIIAPRMTSAPRMPQNKQPVPEFLRHAETGEDQRDDEDVVQRQRKFDDVAGDEFNGFLASAPVDQRHGKQQGQRNPKRAPRQRLPEFDGTRAPVKHTQVQREKKKHAEDETDPVPGRDFRHLRFTIYDLRANCKWIRPSQIANRKCFRPSPSRRFASSPANAPMFGRSPLCHHSTNALAM